MKAKCIHVRVTLLFPFSKCKKEIKIDHQDAIVLNKLLLKLYHSGDEPNGSNSLERKFANFPHISSSLLISSNVVLFRAEH
jgi:hypothetical protein